jgi:hypothetical protein
VKRKMMSWLLALILLMTMLPTAALADEAPGTSSGTVIYVSENGDDSANGDDSEPLKTIGAAFTKAADGDTICLLSDIKLVGKLVLTGNKSVTLAGKAGETAKKITYTKDTSTTSPDLYMIKVGVEYGAATATNLTLQNVTIDAEAQDIRCLRVCPESQLTLENGATVCNGRAVHIDYATGTNDWGGGIVVDSTAKLIMNDGSAVTDCSAEQGGGIYLSGEMEMNGGTISGNTAVGDYFGTSLSRSAHGGAILIRANRADYDESYDVPAKLTMTGGNIQNNKAASDLSAFGGAVAILGTPKNTVDLTNEFIMTGGTISGNIAGYGGAISAYAADGKWWNGNASVKISGNAVITQNTGRNGGGAIALWTSKADDYTSTVEMSGGTISGNETFSSGGGVFLYGKGDSFYMTDGKISDNEAKQGGGISISDTDAAAYLLGGTIQDNKATEGYPYYDDASERSYFGNAVYQDGSLYLDGTKANISGDIRIGCRFDTSGGISTNRFVALVGASDTMNNYELTSFDNESLDGRVVVAPNTITYGTETYSVADAEPYLAHFTHNHKEIITDTDYKAETGTSSQEKSLVLYKAIQKYSVTYTDGIGGTSFADEVTSDLRRGTPTPAFTGGTPTRSGYTFTGWSPAVAATVTANAVYTAQWAPEDSRGNLTVSKTVAGNAGDTEKKFTFTVTLDRSISGTYGGMTFNNGTAVIALKHGESLTAVGLPAGAAYTVEESDNEGYTVTANEATGTISKDGTAVAAFTNSREAPSTQPPTTSAPENPAGPTKPEPTTTPKPAATPQPTVTPQPAATPQPTAVQATVPQTGDTTPLMLWVVLLVISAMGLAGCLWVRFRKKQFKK